MQVTLTVNIEGLGAKIRQARESKGLKPTWVAAQAGMSVPNLYRIEVEDSKSIPLDTLRRLSHAVGIDFVGIDVKNALIEDFDISTPTAAKKS
ncbi:XRE family transcriptional regulator [Rivularia sp. IAM M-261]|nr:XRE family transcriptional regulator [Rivularia sp. IAM M-261]